MTRTQVADASTAEAPADPACDLPGFEELFSRQATRGADGARDAMEMRVVGEPSEIPAGEARFRGRGEQDRVPGSEFFVPGSGSGFLVLVPRSRFLVQRTQNQNQEPRSGNSEPRKCLSEL